MWPEEMVKQQHESIPSILGSQHRLDIDKAIMVAAYVEHDVPNIQIAGHGQSSLDPPCHCPLQDLYLQA
jgi:hypothetical protein